MKMQLYAVKDLMGHPLYDVQAPSPEAACAIVYERLMRRSLETRQNVTAAVSEMLPYEELVAQEVDQCR